MSELNLNSPHCNNCLHWQRYPNPTPGTATSAPWEKGHCGKFDRETPAIGGSKCTAHQPKPEEGWGYQ